MRKLHLVAGVLVVLLIVPSARAQKGDWQAVKDLALGTRISVKTSLRVVCFFVRATEEEVVCATHLVGPIGVISYDRRYHRRSIREVRLELTEETGVAVGALVGAGAGAVVGAVAGGRGGSVTRTGGAVLVGVIGAIVGGALGRDFPVVHGEVIYRR
ncbi:MAG: hypothetical protein ACRD5M_05755 [Candidatus Acidiferrales bacterium]